MRIIIIYSRYLMILPTLPNYSRMEEVEYIIKYGERELGKVYVKIIITTTAVRSYSCSARIRLHATWPSPKS